MQTILDFAKEIVNKLYKHEDDLHDIAIMVTPDAIQLITKDWDVVHNITFSDGWFNVWTNYGFGIFDDQFETVDEVIDFIFE